MRVNKSVYVLLLPLIFVSGLFIGNKVDFKALVKTSLVSQNKKSDLDYTSVEEAFDTLSQSYDGTLDKTKLLDGIKKGLTDATGDPYTEYFSAEESKSFNEEISGSFSGIGARKRKWPSLPRRRPTLPHAIRFITWSST